MPSADSRAAIGSPHGAPQSLMRHRTGPPGVSTPSIAAHPPHVPDMASWIEDFAFRSTLVPPCRPPMEFLYVGSQHRYTLPPRSRYRDTLALRSHFASTWLCRGLTPPRRNACPAHFVTPPQQPTPRSSGPKDLGRGPHSPQPACPEEPRPRGVSKGGGRDAPSCPFETRPPPPTTRSSGPTGLGMVEGRAAPNPACPEEPRPRGVSKGGGRSAPSCPFVTRPQPSTTRSSGPTGLGMGQGRTAATAEEGSGAAS